MEEHCRTCQRMLNCHPGRTAHLGQELRELAAGKALEMQGPDRLVTLPLTGCDTFPVDRGHGERARYSRTG
jgi:hypothetical protein